MGGEAVRDKCKKNFLTSCFAFEWPGMDDSRLPPRVLQ